MDSPRTIADVIAAELEFNVQCGCSARVVVFLASGLARRLPIALTLEEARGRFKCRRCGATAARVWAEENSLAELRRSRAATSSPA